MTSGDVVESGGNAPNVCQTSSNVCLRSVEVRQRIRVWQSTLRNAARKRQLAPCPFRCWAESIRNVYATVDLDSECLQVGLGKRSFTVCKFCDLHREPNQVRNETVCVRISGRENGTCSSFHPPDVACHEAVAEPAPMVKGITRTVDRKAPGQALYERVIIAKMTA